MKDDLEEYYERVKMTHTKQVEKFGWCMCESDDGHSPEGCPK